MLSCFVSRVNDYINSGLEKNLVDPDGGLNIKKKRLKLGLEREVESVINVEFPSEGFQVGVSCLPKIGYSQIWKYLIEEVEFKKQLSVEKPIVKGYNFFKSGKVLGLYSKTDNGVFYVKSQVMPSYSTSGPVYAVKVILSGSAEIKKAYCPCPAGSDGRCNHLAATLFAIEDLFTKATNSAENNDVPCTSKPCTWNVPKKRKLEATTIQSVKFEKHILGKEKRERKASIEVTGKSEYHQQTKDDSEQLLRNVREVEQKTGKKIGLSFIIPHEVPKVVKTVDNGHSKNNCWDITSPVKNGPLSMNEIKEKAVRSLERLNESGKRKIEIEKETKEQHKTRLWFDVRRSRITASKSKRCLIKPTTSPTKVICEVLQYNKTVQTKAMQDGIESEGHIIKEFERKYDLKVVASGFVVSESHPFLGASPDGIIDKETIVEVKKIHLKDGESHKAAMCRLGIYKQNGSELQINKNHAYYHQIQQQMFCTQSNTCYFIVSSDSKTHTDTIGFDSSFWNQVLPKLEDFYFEHIFPELIYPRIYCKEERWNKTLPFPRLE